MIKKAVLVFALTALSTSAFAEIKQLSCVGTEPFWNVQIDVEKSEMTYVDPVVAKAITYKLEAPQQAHGMQDDNVIVYTSDSLTTTVLSSNIAGSTCTDGMSDENYEFHAVVRSKGGPFEGVFYGCCYRK